MIRVEKLGKQYILRHERSGHYRRLSEDLMGFVTKAFLRNARSPEREEFWALHNVSFDVRQGEAVGIIGRNGAGKSTLLKILSRITEPTEGRVYLEGRVASLLEVGTGFHPELTGRENIYLNGAVLGMTRAEVRRKFDEIVEFADVQKFLDTPVKRFSSGMYVRLAFAVAAHLEPEILVVDEVLAVGDAGFQKKCLGKMSEVANGGRTILFVSHNMAAIQSFCTRAVLLDRGRVRQQGPVEEVVSSYLRDVRGMVSAGPGVDTPLGSELLLKGLRITPDPVISTEAFQFELEIDLVKPTRIRELALIIFSEGGARLGVIDLRKTGLRDTSLQGGTFRVRGLIESLQIVEGSYRVGIYIATSNYNGTFPDIAFFDVAPRRQDGFSPYDLAYRGFWEPTFTATIEIDR